MIKKAVLLSVLLFLGCSLPSRAEDREWVSYQKFLEITFLDKFYDTPPAQRDKLTMRGAMSPKNKTIKVSDLVFTILHSAGKELVHVSADGTFHLVPTAKAIKENPMVLSNMPSGEKASFGFSVYAVLPEGLKFSYASLMAGVKQSNDLVKAKAGILRVFAPKFTGVELHFAKPAQQTVQILGKEGVRTLTADAKGIVSLKLDESVLAADPQLVFSERPLDVEISGD